MIRRQKSMRFLGGFYAFPGGKVDAADGDAALLARCRGLSPDEAARLLPGGDGAPALAYWVTALREPNPALLRTPPYNTEAEKAWESAQEALELAQELPPGAERIDALRQAGKLRFEASKLRHAIDGET
jgi:hypothetical protein